jgi:HK97 family phage portal protein
MNVSTVHACVNLIGGAISSLPLMFYRRTDNNEREAYKPDEWWMLNEQPTTAWGAATAWEFASQSLLLRGDSFWRILRASRMSPKIVGFEPLHPLTVRVRRVDDRNVYDVAPQLAQQLGSGVATITLDQDDMLHVPGPGFDGLRGLSQIQSVLRLSGGISLSADAWTSAFFKNSARPDYALETDANLKKDQIDDIKAQIDEQHKGAAKSHRPMVLHGGLKVKAITINPEDAQLMELRRFQVEDVCRAMGVPPFMVGHTEKTTSWGSGVEQMSIGFVKYTLQRHLVKFEQEINRKVFRTSRNFCEFLTAGLERGDLKSRFEAYRIALGRAGEQPWMAYDEIRRLENLAPREGIVVNAGSSTYTDPNNPEPDKGTKQ